MDQPYSNRELDEHFKEVVNSITTLTGEVKEARLEVKKTNGSVGNLKAWRTGITMVVAVIAFLVIPLIIYSFQLSQENLKNTILIEVRTMINAK